MEIAAGGERTLERMAGGAVVLSFDAPELRARHVELLAAGASWDWPLYRPHVTVIYEAGAVELAAVTPYGGPLLFGAEVVADIEL